MMGSSGRLDSDSSHNTTIEQRAAVDRPSGTEQKSAGSVPGRDHKYRLIFELSPELIVILDRKGKLLEINRRVSDWVGYEPEEVVGKNILSLTFATRATKVKLFKRFVARMLGRNIPPYDAEFQHKSGKTVVGRIRATPMKDDKGKTVGDLVMISDVTELLQAERALRESEERFRQVAENARELIWETDAQGLYTYASPVVEEMLGYRPEELVGEKHFYDLFLPEEREKQKQAALAAFARKEPFRDFENKNLHKRGEVVWLLTSGVPVLDEDGNLLGYRGADTDITERKRLDAELAASDKQKRELLNLVLMHDFGTPMTVIQSYIEMLSDGTLGELSEKEHKAVETVAKNIRALSEVRSHMLEASGLDSGNVQLTKERVDIRELVQECIVEAVPLARDRELDLSFDVPALKVLCDPSRIRKAVQNHLRAAIRYASPGTRIEVTARNQNGSLLVSVLDVSPDLPARTPEPAIQAETREKLRWASGIELALARSIIEAHNGRAWFESTQEGGTRLCFTIPATD